jgi:hypothetical protein
MARPGGIGDLLVNARRAGRRGITSADVLCQALRAPKGLTPTAAAVVGSDLDRPQNDAAARIALGALAALLYARPDLVRRGLVVSLARITTGPVSLRLAPAPADAWRLLAMSSLARPAARALISILGDRSLDPGARRALLAALPSYARWRPDTLDLDSALDAAGADDKTRDVILREVIEPLVFIAPRTFTRARIDRALSAFSGRARLRYSLGFLLTRRSVPRATRVRARRWLRSRLPLSHAGPTLCREPCAVLVTHNIADGQGDEIVRVVPLLQSLLDAGPGLTATVLTRRAYLYDHPRVSTSSIRDDRAVEQGLGARWDGIVDFNARTVPGVSTRPELESRVTDLVATTRRLRFVIRAVTGPHHFIFETVRVGGVSVAPSLGLDRLDIGNAYDPTERLLIDLGLPLRAGQDESPGGSLLVGAPSLHAEAAWRRVRGPGRRPAALVNGLGGTQTLKGFTQDKAARLGAEVTGLVDEGYVAILLPNGEPWGGAEMIAATLSHVGPRRRSHVRVAPDPAVPDKAYDVVPRERPEVMGADRVMRLFKYFASYADLVVTVEGWLMHLAYLMGRPFRLFMAPASPVNWLPRGRGPRQQLVLSMSRLSPADKGDLLGDGDLPPAPSHARKLMLMAAARGLREVRDMTSDRLLRRILASPDPELRAVVVEALAHGGPTGVQARLREALADESALVRGAAAHALLQVGADDEMQRDPGSRAMLHAHVAIGRQGWAEVQKLGAAALPALAATARDPDPAIRREARWVAALLIQRSAPAAVTRGRGRRPPPPA